MLSSVSSRRRTRFWQRPRRPERRNRSCRSRPRLARRERRPGRASASQSQSGRRRSPPLLGRPLAAAPTRVTRQRAGTPRGRTRCYPRPREATSPLVTPTRYVLPAIAVPTLHLNAADWPACDARIPPLGDRPARHLAHRLRQEEDHARRSPPHHCHPPDRHPHRRNPHRRAHHLSSSTSSSLPLALRAKGGWPAHVRRPPRARRRLPLPPRRLRALLQARTPRCRIIASYPHVALSALGETHIRQSTAQNSGAKEKH